jgi:hypothetical protein
VCSNEEEDKMSDLSSMSETEASKHAKLKAKMWIFGHPFRPMEKDDFDAFGGAQEGDLIAFPSDDVVLIYSQVNQELYETNSDGNQMRVWWWLA